MKVVYIAGKYSGPNPWAVEQNIRAAEEVAARVIQLGMMPICPHANTRHMEGLADDEFFLAGTMELLRRCDAVVLVPGWGSSSGTSGEVAEAQRLGLPLFGLYTRDTSRENIDMYVSDVRSTMHDLQQWWDAETSRALDWPSSS